MIHPRHFLLAIACFVLASIGFAQIACAATANRASAIVSFCASDGDKARIRAVTPGQQMADLRLVEGVASGTRIVREPPAEMADGSRVTIRK